MDLITVVLDIRQIEVFIEFDLDGLGEDLLAGEHDGVFDGGVQVAAHHHGWVGAGGFKQVSKDAVDLIDFEVDVFDHFACGAGGGQIAADDFDDTGDTGEGVSDFVSEAGGQFAEGGQVFGAGHLGAMHGFNLLAALSELLGHVIEVAAKVADFVVTPGKTDCDVEVAFTDEGYFFLQFDHGALDQVSHGSDGYTADDYGSVDGQH